MCLFNFQGEYPIPGLGGGYPVSGLGEGYPIPGLGEGVPCPRSGWRVTPSQVWTGGIPSQVWMGGTPSQVRTGGTPSQVGGYPLARSGWQGVPHPRSGVPSWPGLDGVPPCQVWMVGGSLRVPPPARTGWGPPWPGLDGGGYLGTPHSH